MKVKPNLPTFTKYDLDTILLEAVDTLVEMEKKQKDEEEEEEERACQTKKRSVSDDDVFEDKSSNKPSKLTKKVKGRQVCL